MEIVYLCKFPSYLHTCRGPKCRFSSNMRVTDGNETTWEMQKIKESRKTLCPGFLLRYGRPFSAVSGTRNPSRTDLVVKPSKKLLMGTHCWAQGERSTAATPLFTWLRCPGCISSWFYQPSWSPTALSDPVYTASVPSSHRQICCTSPCCCSFSLTSQNRDKNNMKTAWTLHSCCCHILFP